MARLTAIVLRDRARAAMLAGGGRGFVRFPEQGALLVCDANRRCEDDAAKARLLDALTEAGFACREQGGLLHLMPQDTLLAQTIHAGECAVDWDSPLHSVQALASRWLKRDRAALTQAGRQLIADSLRLTWQGRVVDGLHMLRAQAAVMQRSADTSGFYEAGAVLLEWCNMQEGKTDEA